MSMMDEIRWIRRIIGEDEFLNIEKFLEAYSEYSLNDVYYSKDVYTKYEEWKTEKNL